MIDCPKRTHHADKRKFAIYMVSIADLIAIAIAVLIAVETFFKWRFGYWQKKGLAGLNPTIPFGDAKGMFNGQFSIGEQFYDFYKSFKSRGLKHGGVFVGLKSFYIPIEPELIKHILQNDFTHFVNRGLFVDEKTDPLSGHLVNLEDAKWMSMRKKLTPTFTSGKMKMMFQTLADCTSGLNEALQEYASNETTVEIKDLLGRFTTDIISSVAFGIECNSLTDPDEEFRKYGKRVFVLTKSEWAKTMLQYSVPHRILKFFRMRLTPKDVESFFMKAVKATVDYREQHNIYRKDFMHLLLQLKNRGKVSDDEKISDDADKVGENALTLNELTAQAFVFFLAGFETSSTAMTFALLELAQNLDVQEKLRQEVNQVLAKHGDKFTYEGVMEMHYLDQVIEETLRKYPPVPRLIRICTKDYKIPKSDVVISKGDYVAISVLGIHHNPEYYPEPERFDPDRFSEENKKLRPGFTWLPFGEGPRNCIGLRFGFMQSKVGLAAVVKNYEITLGKKMQLPIRFEKDNFFSTVDGGVWIDVKKIH